MPPIRRIRPGPWPKCWPPPAVRAPTPPFPAGSWFVCAGDAQGSYLEIIPWGHVFDPEAPFSLGRDPVMRPHGAAPMCCAPRRAGAGGPGARGTKGWRSEIVDTGLFRILKVWTADGFLEELLPPEFAAAYRATFRRRGAAAPGCGAAATGDRALRTIWPPVLARRARSRHNGGSRSRRSRHRSPPQIPLRDGPAGPGDAGRPCPRHPAAGRRGDAVVAGGRAGGPRGARPLRHRRHHPAAAGDRARPAAWRRGDLSGREPRASRRPLGRCRPNPGPVRSTSSRCACPMPGPAAPPRTWPGPGRCWTGRACACQARRSRSAAGPVQHLAHPGRGAGGLAEGGAALLRA